MGEDNDPPKNPFIRWKQHVDAHIGMTLNGLLGIPTMVSKNMNLHSDDSEPRNTDVASSSANTAPASDGTASYPSSSRNSAPNSNPDDALDGVDPNQLLEWHKFIYYSPYSPLKLQQQQQLHLLAPPVPRDVPFGADPYSFTYADAFEDLLRAESGRPLLDLADRSFRNLRNQLRSGSAIEPPYVFFHRMHSQGLLDAYFPRTTAAAAANALARNSSDANADAVNDTNDVDSVVRAVTALAERDPNMWREQMAEEEADKHYDMGEDDDDERGHDYDDEHEHDERYDDDYHDQTEDEARRLGRYDAWAHHDAEQHRRRQAGFGGGGLFDELDRVFRVLGRIIDEDTNGEKGDADASRTNAAKRDSTQPNTEDELYDAVRSAYASAEKSLSTLIKTFSGLSGGNGFDAQTNNHYEESQSSYTSNNQWQDKELKTIQSTEEHTDVFGNRHVKTVVRRVDADGNEVARETHYTVRSPTPQELAIKEADDLGDDQQHEDVEKLEAPKPGKLGKPGKPEGKPSGWFWK